jgi:hypothetical protein
MIIIKFYYVNIEIINKHLISSKTIFKCKFIINREKKKKRIDTKIDMNDYI